MPITQIRGFDQTKPGSVNVGIKKECRVASTANIDVGTGTLLTIDGVTVAAGDRVLVKDQTTPSENGIYVAAVGAWTRAVDSDEQDEVFPGEIVPVYEGTTNGEALFMNDSTVLPIIPGTSAQTFVRINQTGSITLANYIVREVPSGTIDGANTTFTLANTPEAGTERVYLNGILQNVGGGNDYTITGATITMANAPKNAPGNPDVLLVNYISQ